MRLAPTTGALIAARFAQGLGAALLVPCSLALLRQAYEDDGARNRAIAVWAAAGGAAVAAGPVFGGVLVSTLGWRSIFLVNLAVGAAVLAVTLTRAPATTGSSAESTSRGRPRRWRRSAGWSSRSSKARDSDGQHRPSPPHSP